MSIRKEKNKKKNIVSVSSNTTPIIYATEPPFTRRNNDKDEARKIRKEGNE